MKALNRKEVLVNAKANGTLDSFKPLTRDEAFTKKALGLGGGGSGGRTLVKSVPFDEPISCDIDEWNKEGDLYCGYYDTRSFPLIDSNCKGAVTYRGKTYEMNWAEVTNEYGTFTMFGNLSLFPMGDATVYPDTGEPFAINLMLDEGVLAFATKDVVEDGETVNITIGGEYMTSIDKKYLPKYTTADISIPYATAGVDLAERWLELANLVAEGMPVKLRIVDGEYINIIAMYENWKNGTHEFVWLDTDSDLCLYKYSIPDLNSDGSDWEMVWSLSLEKLATLANS